jgi:hypothetical protein
MATDWEEEKRRGQEELEEIRRSFADMGPRMGRCSSPLISKRAVQLSLRSDALSRTVTTTGQHEPSVQTPPPPRKTGGSSPMHPSTRGAGTIQPPGCGRTAYRGRRSAQPARRHRTVRHRQVIGWSCWSKPSTGTTIGVPLAQRRAVARQIPAPRGEGGTKAGAGRQRRCMAADLLTAWSLTVANNRWVGSRNTGPQGGGARVHGEGLAMAPAGDQLPRREGSGSGTARSTHPVDRCPRAGPGGQGTARPLPRDGRPRRQSLWPHDRLGHGIRRAVPRSRPRRADLVAPVRGRPG